MMKRLKPVIKDKYNIAVFLIAIVFSVIIYRGIYWIDGAYLKRRIAVVSFLVVATVACVVIENRFKILFRLVKYAKSLKEFFNVRKVVTEVIVITLVVLASLFLSKIISANTYHTSYFKTRFFLFLAFLLIPAIVIMNYKMLKTRIALLFAVTAFIAGGCFIVTTPVSTGVSWDDQIHYANVLDIVDSPTYRMYSPDQKVIDKAGEHVFEKRKHVRRFSDKLNKSYMKKSVVPDGCELDYKKVVYTPYAFGILVGRGLGLTYGHVYMLGKLCNLIFYIMILSIGIHILTYGKTVLAIIGLIPTNLFLVGSYSYDPWTTAGVALGFALLLSQLQRQDIAEYKSLLTASLIVAIACIPKAIYGVLLFPFLFIPRRYYTSRKKKRIHVIWNVFLFIALVLTVLMPIQSASTLGGDVRGGASVNGDLQMAFIMSNPLRYLKILLKFLGTYLSLDNMNPLFTNFAYMKSGTGFSLIIIVLVISALFNTSSEKMGFTGVRASYIFSNVVLWVLIPTALYISFTPVGLPTINGCQERYLLPMIFPFVAMLTPGNIRVDETLKNNANVLGIVLMAYIFLINYYRLFAGPF